MKRARRRLRARVAELLWQLATVDTFEQLAPLERPIARALAAARCDPPVCRALETAHQQTRWRLTDRAWGGFLGAMERMAEQVRHATERLMQRFAQIAAQAAKVRFVWG